jgi:hypothetical protein
MFLLFAGIMMPVLLIFGVYHLITWFNMAGINRRTFWRRVGWASVVSHAVLVCGFFAFSYYDYLANRNTAFVGMGFDRYLFDRSEFWRLMTLFDTAPMLTLLATAALLDKIGWNPPLVATAIMVTVIVGTLQWYFVGGGIGLLLERFWSGLKTGEDPDEDWL